MAKRAAPTRRVNSGRGHVYYLDGTKMTGRGVTTIISAGFPKNALQYWAAREVASAAVDEGDVWQPLFKRSRDAAFAYLKEAPFRDRDAAARRGTEVHRLAEALHTADDEDEDVEVEVPEELRGHVDQYLDWWQTWWPRETIVEGVVVNRAQQYLGTFDLIATLDGWHGDGSSARVLLDLKTSRSGIYPEIAMQLAAYRYAESYIADPGGDADEAPMPQVDTCAALHVTADGWELIEVDAGPKAFRLFQYVDQVAQFQGSKKDPGWADTVLGQRRTAPNPKF